MVAATDSQTGIFYMFMKGQGIKFPVQAYMVVELTPLTRISTLPAGLPGPLHLFFQRSFEPGRGACSQTLVLQ